MSFFSKLGGFELIFKPRETLYYPNAWQSRAIAVPISNAILIHGLTQEIPRSDARAVGTQAVIRASANLKSLTNDPIVLRALRYSYTKGIQEIMFFSLAAVVASLPFAIGTQWKNLKNISTDPIEEREERQS